MSGHGVRDVLTRAWGEPEIARDSLGQPEITWASETTGWKVKLDCMERNCLVEYVPYHVLTAEYFGPHVVPPGDLAKLRIGMPLAEARQLAPGPVQVRAGLATKYDGVREFVSIDDKTGDGALDLSQLPAAGGEPDRGSVGRRRDATTPVGKAVKVWPDPETWWRATLQQALGHEPRPRVRQLHPGGELFGDQFVELDALPEPVLGMPVDDVKRAYKDQVTVQGKNLVITLPPTEWDRFPTRITLSTAGGRVRELELVVPYKPYPAARNTLLDVFKSKWGLPEEVVEDNLPTLVFRTSDPRVEVREDTDHGAWSISIRN